MCGNIVAAAASITYCCNNSPVFFFYSQCFSVSKCSAIPVRLSVRLSVFIIPTLPPEGFCLLRFRNRQLCLFGRLPVIFCCQMFNIHVRLSAPVGSCLLRTVSIRTLTWRSSTRTSTIQYSLMPPG
jgi:hypothetical protein